MWRQPGFIPSSASSPMHLHSFCAFEVILCFLESRRKLILKDSIHLKCRKNLSYLPGRSSEIKVLYSDSFIDWMSILLIFNARKRSLGQGNVFTRVCHSAHGGGGGICILRGSHPVGWADPPAHENYGIRSASGWNASYWNAYLLRYICWFELLESNFSKTRKE